MDNKTKIIRAYMQEKDSLLSGNLFREFKELVEDGYLVYSRYRWRVPEERVAEALLKYG
jgi:hypothetical protein